MSGNRPQNDREIARISVLFTMLMIFVPLFERYAYNFFYASLYASGVIFYAVFYKSHAPSRTFITLLRTLSFVYTLFLSLRYNPTFAMIGFLTIYQFTRLLEGTFFTNFTMTFLVNLVILFMALPNHTGVWIVLYFVVFVALSTNFLFASIVYFKNRADRAAAGEAAAPGGGPGTAGFARTYALYVVAVSFLVFVFMPRVRLHLFDMGRLNFSGISSIFSFNSIENIKESNALIMRITKDVNVGAYYKMKSYMRYSAPRREWVSTGFGGRRVLPDSAMNFVVNRTTSESCLAPGTAVTSTFFVRYNPEGFVPNMYLPLDVTMNARFIQCDNIDNIYSNESEGPVKVRSFVPSPDDGQLRTASGPDPTRVTMYYTLFPNERMMSVKSLARRITDPHPTRFDKVAAIENYLKNNYKYSLAVGDLYDEYRNSGYDPNEVFLFMVKAGHCEFFASAMVLMCQAVDIPARLVSGYATPEYNEAGGYFIVRGSDAHAWVEVYFPNYGFVTFDPTAASVESEKSRSALLKALNKYLDGVNFYIEQYISYYSNELIFTAVAAAWRKAADLLASLDDGYLAPLRRKTAAIGWRQFLVNFYGNARDAWFVFAIAFWLALSDRLRPLFYRLMRTFLDDRTSYRIARLVTLAGRPDGDFYSRFAALFAARGLTLGVSETPYEFHERIKNACPLPGPALEGCRMVADAFYARDCAGRKITAAEMSDIDRALFDISIALGKTNIAS